MSEETMGQLSSGKKTDIQKTPRQDKIKISKKKKSFINSILLFEKLHRDFLEQIKSKLDLASVYDINNTQALILYNIGNEKLTVTKALERGCYLGSNISYNLKKLTQNEYIIQTQSERDKRSCVISLSQKGAKIHKLLDDMFEDMMSQICYKYRELDTQQLYEYLGIINKLLYHGI